MTIASYVSIRLLFWQRRVPEASFWYFNQASLFIFLACVIIKKSEVETYIDPIYYVSVLPSVGIAALSAREAEGRTNISAGEMVISTNDQVEQTGQNGWRWAAGPTLFCPIF